MSELAIGVTLSSTVISGVFAAHVLRQYIGRRKLHQLAWSLGLVMYSLAALAELLSEILGWSPGLYRFYYALAPSLVAVLGLGSLFLVMDRKFGYAFAAYTVILFAAFLYVIMTTDVNTAAFVPNTIVGGNGWPSGSAVRTFSPLFTIPGAILLIGIAAYSYWKGRQWFNLFIGLGALVVAAGGAMSRLNVPAALYASEFIGIAMMYIGFIKSVEVISGRETRAVVPAKPIGGGS